MPSTRIDTGGKLDDETVAAANARLAAMPALHTTRTLNSAADTALAALPIAPHAQPDPLTIRDATEEYKAQQEPAPEKRTRTTVGKLLQRYQERVAEYTQLIADAEHRITVDKLLQEEYTAGRKFWREAIAEIERD